jgi:hypothetical protein
MTEKIMLECECWKVHWAYIYFSGSLFLTLHVYGCHREGRILTSDQQGYEGKLSN